MSSSRREHARKRGGADAAGWTRTFSAKAYKAAGIQAQQRSMRSSAEVQLHQLTKNR